MPVDDGRDARRVIAAIFQPPQPFDQPVGYLVLAQNADDAAHDYSVSVRVERSRDMLAPVPRLRSGRTGAANINPRSEERRVGKGCVSTCRYRWSRYL